MNNEVITTEEYIQVIDKLKDSIDANIHRLDDDDEISLQNTLSGLLGRIVNASRVTDDEEEYEEGDSDVSFDDWYARESAGRVPHSRQPATGPQFINNPNIWTTGRTTRGPIPTTTRTPNPANPQRGNGWDVGPGYIKTEDDGATSDPITDYYANEMLNRRGR